jgi:hypothetical protein
MGFRIKSGTPPFTLQRTSSLEHAFSMRDGLKRGNFQLKSAINFLRKNTKTLIGAKASQFYGLKKSGGVFSL